MKNTKKLLAILISFAIAFTCFVCVPFTALAETVTVNSASELKDALSNDNVSEIVIGSPIVSTEKFSITRSVTLEGGDIASNAYHLDGGKLEISGEHTVNLINVKIWRNGDTVRLDSRSTVTISGGEIKCTNTSESEGALYAAGGFSGTVTVTGGTHIHGNTWAVYNGDGCTGTFNLIDCTISNDGSGNKNLMRQNGPCTYNLGDNDPNHHATFTTTGGRILKTGQGGAKLNIYSGAEINHYSSSGTDYCFDIVNDDVTIKIYGGEFNIYGLFMNLNSKGDNATVENGEFNLNKSGFRINDDNASLTINGGTFDSKGEDGFLLTTPGYNSPVTINGGTFTASYALFTIKGSADRSVTINGGSFTAGTDMFVFNNSNAKYKFNNVNITSSTGNIFNLGDNVRVDLDNCQITATSPAMVATGSDSSAIYAVNGSNVTGDSTGTTISVTKPILYKIGDDEYAELSDALNNVTENGTITLNDNISGGITLDADKTFTLAGNGKSISGAVTVSAGNVTLSGVTASAVKVNGSSNVTISGGAIGGGDATALELLANFSGTVNVVGKAQISSNSVVIKMYSATGSVLNLKDCSVARTGSGTVNAIEQSNDTTINIGDGEEGHEVTFTNADGMMWIAASENVKLNINDGAVFTNTKNNYCFDVNKNYVTVNFNGGEFNFAGLIMRINQSYDNITVNGGTFNCTGTNPAFNMNDSDSYLTINDGTFNSETTSHIIEKNNGAVTINGGTFTNTAGSIIKSISGKGNGELKITDGEFTANKSVALIESTITANISGGEFTTTGNATESVINITGGATVNVSGGEFIHSNDGPAICTKSTANNAKVYVTGGTFTTKNPFEFNSGAELKFDGVTISQEEGIILTLGPGVLVTLDNGCLFEITNGYPYSDYIAIGDESAPATLVYKNGSSLGKNWEDYIEDVNVQNNNPKFFEIDGTEYETIAEALSAVQNGETIELCRAFTSDITLDADKTYTFTTGDYSLSSKITVTAGTVTLKDAEASGVEVGGNATVIVDGGIYNAGEGNAIEILGDFTGTFTANGGAEFNATSGLAYYENSGSEGQVNFNNCSLTVGSGDLSSLNGKNIISLGKPDGNGIVTITDPGDVFWFAENCETKINTYDGVTITGGTPFKFHANAKNNVLNIYGGKFISGSSKNMIVIRNNAEINITGGQFDLKNISAEDIGTAVFSFENTAKDVKFSIKDQSFTRDNKGEIVYSKAQSGTFTFENCNFTQNGIASVVRILDISAGSENAVNITNCNFYSFNNSAVEFTTTNSKTLTVNILGESNTKFTSKITSSAVKKDNGVTINDANNKLVQKFVDFEGAKIFRMAGKFQEYWPGIERTIGGLAPNTTYTFSFNYRATGAITLWEVFKLNGVEKEPTSDTGTTITYTFTTDGTESSNIYICFGRKENPSIGRNTTLYLADFSLKASGSSDNLIENGDFSNCMEGWKLLNHVGTAANSSDFIPYIEDFFDDSALEEFSLNTAIKLIGGDRHEVQFKVYLEANTSYTFSYYYRAYGDTPLFGIQGDGVTISNEVVDSSMFKKTYTVTNTDTQDKFVRFYFRGGAGSIDNIIYLSGLSLKKNGTAGANLIADLNSVFGLTDSLRLNQNDSTAMINIVGHGWLGNFKSDSDTPADVNTGSSRYTSVISVPENFFVRLGDADVLEALISYLLGETDDGINPYFDATRDGAINIIDLVRLKKQMAGAFGADVIENALKSEIMNAANTQPTGTVYYVSNSGSSGNSGTSTSSTLDTIANANKKAKAGDTILLKRGDTWRVSAGTDASITFKAGVTYGAYGTGAKPEILGSSKNWANTTWKDEGNNIWSVNFRDNGYGGSGNLHTTNTPGNIYFIKNNEITIGVGIKDSAYLTESTKLSAPGDFACKRGVDFRDNSSKVYIYCEGNPSTVYDRIEIAESRTAVELNSNVTVDNIAVKFAGAHGLAGNNLQNVKITNCEIGYIGGAWNSDAAMGNGIQFGQGGSNLEASHNYIYQCYDAGVTYQKWEGSGEFKNIKFTDNLLTNNFDNIEIWSSDNGLMQNITIEGNVLKDAGYCWSWEQRFNTGNVKIYATNIYGGKNSYNTNSGNSLTIKDNIFDNTRANHVCWYWDNTHPATYEYLTVSGNSFYQKKGSFDDYSMQYGSYGLQYASSQESLEYTVKKFDPNPKFICWVETD